MSGGKALTGRLDKRVTILRPPGAGDIDEYGQPVDTWTEVSTVWAAIESLQGRELFAALQLSAEITTQIRIRYRDDVDRTMRLRRGDREFEILYIPEPERAKRELVLMCKERQ